MAINLQQILGGGLAGLLSGGPLGAVGGAAGGALMGAVGGAATGALAGTKGLQGATVIASGHRMLLLQTATGKRILVRRAPRRRQFRSHGGSFNMNQMMKLMVMRSMMGGRR